MKNLKWSLLIVCALLLTQTSQAQFLKNLGKKLEEKAGTIVDKTIDDALNGKEKANDGRETKTNADNGHSASAENAGPFRNIPNLAYDFEAGTALLFADNFQTETLGRMGSHWTSNGTGTVSEVAGFDGKWLKLYDANTYKIKDLLRLPEQFTLEFDIIAIAETSKNIALDFGFDYVKGVGSHHYLADQNPVNMEASYRFDKFEFTSNEMNPRKKSVVEANMSYFINDVMHVKMRIEGDRICAYVNDTKVLDTEMIDPVSKKYFYIAVENEKNQGEVYLGNVKINKL